MQKKITLKKMGTWCKKILALAVFITLSYQTVTAQYCTVSVALSSEQIGNVTFSNVNNSSVFASGVGYQDFTSITANVFQGLSYPLTVTSVNSFNQDQVLVWIDYNNNGVFTDAGELVFTSAIGSGPYSTTIAIPGTAPTGVKRMRIRLHDTSDGPNATPCGASNWGQTEDYSVNIQANTPCAGTPIPGNTLSTLSTACPGATFTLSLQTATVGTGVTYQWQSGPSATGPWTAIGGATSTTYVATMGTSATYYRCVVTCSSNSGNSTPVLVNLTPASGCYCTPSSISCAASDVITNVTFAGINNTTACSATGGYSNFTTTVPAGTPFAGASNPISVKVGPGGTEHVGVWIDFNQSGTFDPAEFTYLGSGNNVVINGNIAIPANAFLGPTRMRVRVQWNTAVAAANSCTQTSGFGEVEDYTVNITQCLPVVITSQPANATTVCGGSVTFTTSASGSLPSYSWQYRTSATGVWLTVPNAAPYTNVNTAALTVSTSTSINGYQFRALVTGACTAVDFTSAATLTVNQLAAVITPATTQNICGGAIVPISIGNTGASTTTTFASAANLALAIPENGTGVTNVINATLPATSQITDIKVKFNITHTWGGDLIMALKAPNGQVYNLSYALNGTDNGPGGFTNTVVSLNPLNPLGVAYPLLSTGATPFTNTYKADGRTAATATALDNGVNIAVRPTGPTGFTATTSLPADIYGAVGSGTGAWTLAMYDFYDDGANGGNINRLVNWSMDITYGALASGVFSQSPASPNTIFTDAAATIAYDGITPINKVFVKPAATTTYTVAINTGICTTSATLLVNVNNAVGGTPTLSNQTVCNNNNATFALGGGTLSGGPTFTHNYQVSTNNGISFSNIVNGGVYSGANTNTLVITGATTAMNGYQYRDSINTPGNCGAKISTVGTLTVNPTPVVTISAAPYTKLFPGLTTTLTAAVSPNAASSYQWVRNGSNVTGATSNKYVANIDALGTYTVNVSDVNGCVSTATIPASITISDSVNKETLFIYPSPNTGKFQVRYYSDLTDTKNAPGYVQIFDEKGALVFTRAYSPGAGYGSMQVDLGTHGRGIYRVDLLTSSGDRIKTGSVMVF